MGFFDVIGDAFKKAVEEVKEAAKTVVEKVKDVIHDPGHEVFDFAKDILSKIGWALADGMNLFNGGWSDVFSGEFKQGLSKIAFGLAEVAGVTTPALVHQYENAVGETSLWSLRQSKTRKDRLCFSEYRDEVMKNIRHLGLIWNEKMETNLRAGLTNMPWINPAC